MFREGLDKKRELLRKYVLHSKQLEKMQVKKINQELLERIKKVDDENLQERKKRIGSLKEHEKIIPFKVRYLQLKRKEGIKIHMHKMLDVEENVVTEKKKELENLEKIENALHEQLKTLRQSKLGHLKQFPSNSVILNSDRRNSPSCEVNSITEAKQSSSFMS